MAEKAIETPAVGKKRQTRAMVFELENLAVNGRQVLFDVLKRALAEKDVDIKPYMFVRYCLDLPLKQGIAELLKIASKGRVSEDKILETVSAKYVEAVTGSRQKLSADLEKILKKAASRNLRLGAVSNLPADSARQIVQALVGDIHLPLFSYSVENKGHPTADAWLKLAKQVGVVPPLCLAVATSMRSAKGALSAGMRCAAVLDDFTRTQDFGGVDCVVEGLDKSTSEELLGIMEP